MVFFKSDYGTYFQKGIFILKFKKHTLDFMSFCFLGIGLHYIAQDSLKLATYLLLPQRVRCVQHHGQSSLFLVTDMWLEC